MNEKSYHHPLVSVLMPAYAQAEYVAEALDSLLVQTYADWEVAVVDDGSPDNVADIVAPYVAKDSRVRFYHTENHGLSGTRNFAARNTSGKYIVALDADDVLAPQYLERCVAALEKDSCVKVAYTDWQFFGASRKTPRLRYKGYRSLLINNDIYCTAMYRREDYDRVGGYDEKIPHGFEDWELWLRILDENAVVAFIPERLFRYRIKTVSMSTQLHGRERREETCAYIYDKHRDKYDAFFGNRLSELQRLDALEYRLDKWRRRSVWSRLWYAITGRF